MTERNAERLAPGKIIGFCVWRGPHPSQHAVTTRAKYVVDEPNGECITATEVGGTKRNVQFVAITMGSAFHNLLEDVAASPLDYDIDDYVKRATENAIQDLNRPAPVDELAFQTKEGSGVSLPQQ
jgi:hypothetical protein